MFCALTRLTGYIVDITTGAQQQGIRDNSHVVTIHGSGFALVGQNDEKTAWNATFFSAGADDKDVCRTEAKPLWNEGNAT